MSEYEQALMVEVGNVMAGLEYDSEFESGDFLTLESGETFRDVLVRVEGVESVAGFVETVNAGDETSAWLEPEEDGRIRFGFLAW